jgi:hypothetical protein
MEDFVARVAFAALDANQDEALNADEWGRYRSSTQPPPFGEVDADHDGLIVVGEFLRSIRPTSPEAEPAWGDRRVLATSLVFVADDFVVDLYHNGVKVPDERRTLLEEVFGATVERVDVEVREGDWLVFNVVNNRLRWGGVQYFGVAGLNAGASRGSGSSPGPTGRGRPVTTRCWCPGSSPIETTWRPGRCG